MLDPRRSVFVSVLVVASVYLVTLGLTERRGLWITDNANKYLQVRAALTGSPLDFSIPWPGRPMDPEFAFNPLPAPFSLVENGALYSQYPPFFAALSALPYRLLGFAGLYAIPLLSSILMLVGLARLARQVGVGLPGRHATVLLAGLCTPVWFYAVVFWEHAPAACCLVWSLHYCLRSREKNSDACLVTGAVLAACGVYFRDETLLFCAMVCAFALVDARGRRLRRIACACGAMAATLVPLLLFQWATIGSALGYHVRANLGSLTDHVASRAIVFYKLLLASHSNLVVSLAIATPFVVAFAWNPRLAPRLFRRALPFVALFASIAAMASLEGFLSSGTPIVHLLRTNSLFPAAPILFLALIQPRESAAEGEFEARWVWLFALGYATLYLITAPRITSGGIHWGNRFLFPLYPLLTVLAVRNLAAWFSGRERRWRWQGAALASTLLVSLAAQGYSMHLLHEKKEFSYRLNRKLAARDETIVVSDVWWAPQAMFAGFTDKPMFYVRSVGQLEQLRTRIRHAGHDRFVLVTKADGTRGGGPEVTVEDGDLNFFSLTFHSLPTGP